ncbi:MAG: hypothetical protein M3P70_01640 [Actinomycetota bacterium]|nr:hypothetical protein [Actinomycetota bacterium]
MVRRNRTPAAAGALAAGLLVESCRTGSVDSLTLGVVSDLALDLERGLDALASPAGEDDDLVEAALACADLATLAACNLSGLPEDGEPLAAAAVHLAAGAARALVVLVEARAWTLDEDHAENTLRDVRGALWRADLAVRQVTEIRKREAPD